MKYSFVAFSYGKIIDFDSLLVGDSGLTLDQIKEKAREFYFRHKPNPIISEVMLKAGEDLQKPIWYENIKTKK